MNVSDFKPAIVYAIYIASTPEKVWEALTSAEFSRKYFFGFGVEAELKAGGSFIVVDTGPWIFGKKVMLPAGTIRDIDPDTETIFVDLTKDAIKNAPEFDEKTYRDQSYRNELGSYYSGRSGTT